MPNARMIHRVAGDPERIASRMAVRLRHLGDQIQVISATEFIHSPQPAERLLFFCPRHVRVVVLPADEPGHCLVVLEPRRESWWRWRWPPRLALAAVTALAAWWLRDSSVAVLLGTIWPLLAAILAPWALDSGWQTRLLLSARVGATPALDRVTKAARWLSLSETERETVLAEVREQAAALRGGREWGGRDDRSTEQRLGWPLWHRASGRDPVTGQPRQARGWLAIGQHASGRVAVGQVARGWLAIGQAAWGLAALGQAAAGLLAFGQFALAALAAGGQMACGLLAAGQLALGAITAGSSPERADLFFWLALPATVVAFGLVYALLTHPRAAVQASVERQLAERGEAPLPDETSLSLVDRMATDPERGLSPAEVEVRREG